MNQPPLKPSLKYAVRPGWPRATEDQNAMQKEIIHMRRISAIIVALVITPSAAMATPDLPSGYDTFKIAYTEQRQFEGKVFRACLAKAEKPARPKKGVLQEEAMPLQSNCMQAEAKRLLDDLKMNIELDQSKARTQAGLSEKWDTKEVPSTERPEYKARVAQEKWNLAQAAWSDGLTRRCMADFDMKTDDPKIIMPYIQSCVLTETVRRTIWYQRNRGFDSWFLKAENRFIELYP
jgi:hypothetical protein